MFPIMIYKRVVILGTEVSSLYSFYSHEVFSIVNKNDVSVFSQVNDKKSRWEFFSEPILNLLNTESTILLYSCRLLLVEANIYQMDQKIGLF